MGKTYDNVKGTNLLTEREKLQTKFNNARANLLAAVAFTVINIVLLFVDASSYFLFSIFVPYFITLMAMLVTGKLPAEFYAEDWAGYEFLDGSVFWIVLVIAIVIIGLYLLSWFLSKKNKVGWLVFALVIFCIDTLLMLFLQGISESIMDIVFHVWVIVSLTSGIIAYNKLKKLPEEEIVEIAEVGESVEEIENIDENENIEENVLD
ncbi:MAG: hypothetical protein J6J73_00525 [Agathobacter sp.]|nr:hypothetical protein [Agathobacter sp.]